MAIRPPLRKSSPHTRRKPHSTWKSGSKTLLFALTLLPVCAAGAYAWFASQPQDNPEPAARKADVQQQLSAAPTAADVQELSETGTDTPLLRNTATAPERREQIAAHNAVLNKLAGQSNRESLAQIAHAYGSIIELTRGREERLELLNALILRHLNTVNTDEEVAFDLRWAMKNRLNLVGSAAEEHAIFDGVINKYRDSTHEEERARVLLAYFCKAEFAVNKDDRIRLLDEALSLYAEKNHPMLQRAAAFCMVTRALASQTEDEKLRILDQMLSEFHNAPDTLVQQQVLYAMEISARFSERTPFGIAVLETIIEKYKNSDNAYFRNGAWKACQNAITSVRDAESKTKVAAVLEAKLQNSRLAGYIPQLPFLVLSTLDFPKTEEERITRKKDYEDLIARHADSGDRQLQNLSVDLMLRTVGLSGDDAEKIPIYSKIIDIETRNHPETLTRAGEIAIFAKAKLIPDEKEKLALYDMAIRQATIVPSRLSVVRSRDAWFYRANLLAKGDYKKYDALIDEYRRDLAAMTVSDRDSVELLFSDSQDAIRNSRKIQIYDSILDTYKEHYDREIQQRIGAIHVLLAEILTDDARKRALLDEIIAKYDAAYRTEATGHLPETIAAAIMLKAEMTANREKKLELYSRVIDAATEGKTFSIHNVNAAKCERQRILSGEGRMRNRPRQPVGRDEEERIFRETLASRAKSKEQWVRERSRNQVLSEFIDDGDESVRKAVLSVIDDTTDSTEKIPLYQRFIEAQRKNPGHERSDAVFNAHMSLLRLTDNPAKAIQIYNDMKWRLDDKRQISLLFNVAARLDKTENNGERVRFYEVIIDDISAGFEPKVKSFFLGVIMGRIEELPDKKDRTFLYGKIADIESDDFMIKRYAQKAAEKSRE